VKNKQWCRSSIQKAISSSSFAPSVLRDMSALPIERVEERKERKSERERVPDEETELSTPQIIRKTFLAFPIIRSLALWNYFSTFFGWKFWQQFLTTTMSKNNTSDEDSSITWSIVKQITQVYLILYLNNVSNLTCCFAENSCIQVHPRSSTFV